MQVLKNMASYVTFGVCLGYQFSFYHWSACEQVLIIAFVLGDISSLLAENMGVTIHKLKALKKIVL